VVLIPLSTLVFKSFELNWDDYVHIITSKRVLSAFRVSFSTALARRRLPASLALLLLGLGAVFIFRQTILSCLDRRSFCLATAVAGIVLATIFQPSGFLASY